MPTPSAESPTPVPPPSAVPSAPSPTDVPPDLIGDGRAAYWRDRTAERAPASRQVTGDEWNVRQGLRALRGGHTANPDAVDHCLRDLGTAEWLVRQDRDRLATALDVANARLAAMEDAQRKLTALGFRSARVQDGALHVSLEMAQETAMLIGAHLRTLLEASNAENYVEMLLGDAAGLFTVTVRRTDRPTAHELRRAAEARVAALEAADTQRRARLAALERWGMVAGTAGDPDMLCLDPSGAFVAYDDVQAALATEERPHA